MTGEVPPSCLEIGRTKTVVEVGDALLVLAVVEAALSVHAVYVYCSLLRVRKCDGHSLRAKQPLERQDAGAVKAPTFRSMTSHLPGLTWCTTRIAWLEYS